MLYPTYEPVADERPGPGGDDALAAAALAAEVRKLDEGTLDGGAADEGVMAEAVRNLRALIMAGERYRSSVAGSVGLGTTESQAVSYLAVHGARGQSELARDLNLTSSAATALVDRLERHGAAERSRHPSDRRRMLIRLTDRGQELAVQGQQPLLASLGLVESADLPLVASWLGIIAGDLHARTR
jgi:DNA-binding MarR family transcriptional regulator